MHACRLAWIVKAIGTMTVAYLCTRYINRYIIIHIIIVIILILLCYNYSILNALFGEDYLQSRY